MKDYKCTVNIKPLYDTNERLGMPVVLVTSGVRQITRPPTISPNGFVQNRGWGLIGIFTEPHMGGNRFWLVVSWNWLDNNTDQDQHQCAVTDEPGTMDWITEPVTLHALWSKGLRSIKVRLAARVVDALFCRYEGGAYGDAKWLAGRLQPRRAQSALRVVNPDHVQLWIKL